MAKVNRDFVSMTRKKPIESYGVFSKGIVGGKHVGIDKGISEGHFERFGNNRDEVMWEVTNLGITSHQIGLGRI